MTVDQKQNTADVDMEDEFDFSPNKLDHNSKK